MPSQWNPPPHPPPGGTTKSGKPTSVFTDNSTRPPFGAWEPPEQEVDKGAVNKELGPTRRFQVNQALERRGGLRFNYASR